MNTKRELQIIGFSGYGILIAGFCVLGSIESWDKASYWFLLSGLLWGFAMHQTWKRLDLNRTSTDSPLYKSFGWANRVTLLRGGLIALTGGFLLQPQNTGLIGWLPGLLYGFAAILDRFDGFIARRSQQTSLLGCELDTVFDALGLLIVPILAVAYGKIHWSYLLLSVAYYTYQWAMSLRRHRDLPIYPIMPSILRRTLAGFQMGFIAVVLLPPFQAPLTLFLSIGFMVPVITGFIIDWCVATGLIKPHLPGTAAFFNRLSTFNTTILQPALRILLSISLFFIISRSIDFPLAHQSENSLSNTILCYGLSVCALLLMLGLAGRIGALFLIVLLSLHYAGSNVDAIASAIIFGAVWILLFGSGRFSLWRREDIWINRHDGA